MAEVTITAIHFHNAGHEIQIMELKSKLPYLFISLLLNKQC